MARRKSWRGRRPPQHPRSDRGCRRRQSSAPGRRGRRPARGQRREVVVGDLGTRGRNNADERRFADVREADQATSAMTFSSSLRCISSPGRPGLANLGIWRVRGRKMAVAPAAAASRPQPDNRLPCPSDRPRRGSVSRPPSARCRRGTRDDQVVTVCAAHPLGAAILAVGRVVLALVAEVHQGGQVVVGHKMIAPPRPPSPPSSGRPPPRIFAVERHRTVATLAGVQPDRGGINKITGCHVVPHLQKITKNERAAKARPYQFLLLDRAALAVTAHALEVNAAIDQSRQGVIAADADALTRMDVGAALTDEDVAGRTD